MPRQPFTPTTSLQLSTGEVCLVQAEGNRRLPTVVFTTTLSGFITTQSETHSWVSAFLFQWAVQVKKRVKVSLLNKGPSRRHRAVEWNGGEKLVAISSQERCPLDLLCCGPHTPWQLEHTSCTCGASSVWQGAMHSLHLSELMCGYPVTVFKKMFPVHRTRQRQWWWERGSAVVKPQAMQRYLGPECYCCLWLSASHQGWDLPDLPQPPFKTNLA